VGFHGILGFVRFIQLCRGPAQEPKLTLSSPFLKPRCFLSRKEVPGSGPASPRYGLTLQTHAGSVGAAASCLSVLTPASAEETTQHLSQMQGSLYFFPLADLRRSVWSLNRE